MSLRVCILIPSFSDGGAQKQCIFLLNELRRREDVSLTLIYFNSGVHDDLLHRERIDIRVIKARSNYDPRNILEIRKILIEIKPEILMTWLHSCDVYGYFLKISVPGIRWIMTERDSFYPRDPRYVLRKLLGRYADVIVANSEKGAAYWRAARAKGHISTVSNIVHVERCERNPSIGSRVISIGRLEPQKNTRTVVEAFVELGSRRPDLTFAIIGDGSERSELEAIVRNSAAANRIKFLGFRKDVAHQIQESSVVVSASHHEGLPNVMLESVAGGRVVVVSDIPEHRELLGPRYPFYVGDRSDPSSFASTIEAAVSQPGDTEILDYARGRLENMTPTAVASAYLEVMKTALGRK